MFSRDKEARRRIEDLEEKFNRLSRDFHALTLEWENAYDKLRSMMQRTAKRAEVLQKEMDGGTKPLSPSEESLVAPGNHTPRAFLTPAQERLQNQIMRHRAAMGAKSE